MRRQYQTSLNYVWSGLWLKVAGYPKIDLEKDYKPITTERAEGIFLNGKEPGPIQLRP
jgi:hypothetical protein